MPTQEAIFKTNANGLDEQIYPITSADAVLYVNPVSSSVQSVQSKLDEMNAAITNSTPSSNITVNSIAFEHCGQADVTLKLQKGTTSLLTLSDATNGQTKMSLDALGNLNLLTSGGFIAARSYLGTTTPANIPTGISYAEVAGDGVSKGWPANAMGLAITIKLNQDRCLQFVAGKNNSTANYLYFRAGDSTTASKWTTWKRIQATAI